MTRLVFKCDDVVRVIATGKTGVVFGYSRFGSYPDGQYWVRFDDGTTKRYRAYALEAQMAADAVEGGGE